MQNELLKRAPGGGLSPGFAAVGGTSRPGNGSRTCQPHNGPRVGLGYFVERYKGGDATGDTGQRFGVFRGIYDADGFFDKFLVQGGYENEAEAEREAARLLKANGAIFKYLPENLTDSFCTRLEQHDRLQRRCVELQRRCIEMEIERAKGQAGDAVPIAPLSDRQSASLASAVATIDAEVA